MSLLLLQDKLSSFRSRFGYLSKVSSPVKQKKNYSSNYFTKTKASIAIAEIIKFAIV